jgi:pilus assembly protein Flp/PilA
MSLLSWSAEQYSVRFQEEAHVSRFYQFVTTFFQREDGPTAVEYSVMLSLIIVVCFAAITSLGKNANNSFKAGGNAVGSTAS